MHNDKIGITVDEIEYLSDNQILLRVIPDYKSIYFIPAHMRYIQVNAKALEPQLLAWINEYHLQSEENRLIIDGSGNVSQGGYYLLPQNYFNRLVSFRATETIIDDTYDIFSESKVDSPYNETLIVGETLIDSNEIGLLNVKTKYNNDTYLYGIYAGQGDMLLLITAEKNAYLVDCNIYSDSDLDAKIALIKHILNKHKMDDYKLKGLIITHKHSDHIRGAYRLIDSGKFDIDYFIMNLDYKHSTSLVYNLCTSAKIRIPCWVNLNHPCEIIEGQTRICFKNPDRTTRLAPDINDSSIVMCIRYEDNLIHLTGDAHANILSTSMNCRGLEFGCERLLKVSHHGSRTGTSSNLLNMINPSKAFISAGFSKKYNHPHPECINLLTAHLIDTVMSKNIRKTVEYRCTGEKIIVSY